MSEARMSNDEGNPNDEARREPAAIRLFVTPIFAINSSFEFRH
jgi:hypothetical protein